MKNNWILTSVISGILGGVLTFILTCSWRVSLISAVMIAVLIYLMNPQRRYMRAFYIVVFPLISNIYFILSSKTENYDIQGGVKELDTITVVILGLISIICLLFDYLERKDNLKGFLIEISKNSTKNVSGENININQKINKNDSDK